MRGGVLQVLCPKPLKVFNQHFKLFLESLKHHKKSSFKNSVAQWKQFTNSACESLVDKTICGEIQREGAIHCCESGLHHIAEDGYSAAEISSCVWYNSFEDCTLSPLDFKGCYRV